MKHNPKLLLKLNHSEKKIIYSNFCDERQWIIDFSYEQEGRDPVFVLGPESMRGWVKENYSHAVFQESMQLGNAQFDYAIIGKPAVPVDAKIIGTLSKYEKVKNNITRFMEIRREMDSKLPIVRISSVHLSKNHKKLKV